MCLVWSNLVKSESEWVSDAGVFLNIRDNQDMGTIGSWPLRRHPCGGSEMKMGSGGKCR